MGCYSVARGSVEVFKAIPTVYELRSLRGAALLRGHSDREFSEEEAEEKEEEEGEEEEYDTEEEER